jgi:heme/copper-type cytochrome/quinol oxidase subunit 3
MHQSLKSILVIAASAAVLTIAAYFVLRNVPPYFVWNEASYGAYYWPRAGFLFPHVMAGLLALVVGPFQFWARLRNGYPKVHRISGRIYLLSVLLGAVAGMAMAVTSSRGLAYGSGLFGLSVAWLLTSGMAFVSIRKRNFIQHKQWMVRSYVLTFAFVTFRGIADLMIYFGIGQGTDRLGAISWACWAVPLLLTELVIQGRQVFAGGARQTA